MKCATCGSESPESKRFCADCGASFEQPPVSSEVQRAVDRALKSKLKDAQVVEIETTQAIVSRLTDWAKIFGFFVGIPLTLFALILGYLGVNTYSDFSTRVRAAKEEALKPLQQTKLEADRIAQAYKDLDSQLQQTKALGSQVSDLSEKVAKIEQVVRFKPSASLTPALRQNLDQALHGYHAYLKSLGLNLTQSPPTVFVDPAIETNSYYLPAPKNQIVLSRDLAPVQDAPLREYTHHILIALKPAYSLTDSTGLESGLADYLPGSFDKRSDFGREIWEVFRKRYPDAPIPNRDLDNHHSFSEIQVGKTELHDAGTVWGGAFWELRQTLGQSTTDKLLLSAWMSFDVSRAADLKVFPEEIVRQDTAIASGQHVAQIREIFRRRGLEITK
jgi:hypothetical protein